MEDGEDVAAAALGIMPDCDELELALDTGKELESLAVVWIDVRSEELGDGVAAGAELAIGATETDEGEGAGGVGELEGAGAADDSGGTTT